MQILNLSIKWQEKFKPTPFVSYKPSRLPLKLKVQVLEMFPQKLFRELLCLYVFLKIKLVEQ